MSKSCVRLVQASVIALHQGAAPPKVEHYMALGERIVQDVPE